MRSYVRKAKNGEFKHQRNRAGGLPSTPLHVQPWLPFPVPTKKGNEKPTAYPSGTLEFRGIPTTWKAPVPRMFMKTCVPLGWLLLCVWALSHQDFTGRQHSRVLSQPAKNMKCILIKQASWKLVPAFLQTSSRTHSLSWFCSWFFCCSESKSYACNSLLRLKSH